MVEKERPERVNERKDEKLANASARENEQLKRKVSQGVENAPEEKNINILLKSNYILYGIQWIKKKEKKYW